MKLRKTAITSALAGTFAGALVWAGPALAHCDTLDGPVVSAAQRALDSGSVDLVLPWVQKSEEAEIRNAFKRARAVRKSGGEAKALADAYFYETLVRVHRQGEGAPYTGLKPAGHVEPPVAAADEAIATGRLAPLGKLLSERIDQGLHVRYQTVMAKKRYSPDDVAAGRAYTSAYVEFVHYAERLYDAAQPTGHDAHAAAHAH